MPYFEIIAIAILILLNGFFAGAEISTVSVRRSQILDLINRGNNRARQVKSFLDQPDSFLATIQVGVTLASTTASVIAGAALVPVITPLLERLGLAPATADKVAVAAVVVLLSYLLLVVGELVPKYLAYASPMRLAMFSAPAVGLLSRVAAIPVRILTGSTRLLLAPLGLVRQQRRGVFTEEEINLILSEGQKEGRFLRSERDLIRGVFEFAETTVRQAMTPRIEVVGVDLNSGHEQILKTVTEKGFSRYPVYEKSLDNIKGIIHTRDIISTLVHSEVIILQDIIRPVSFVPDSKPIADLLPEFQRRQQHMAVVLDEFGGTAGLITIEDILEEIVGDIRDEWDAEPEPFVRIDGDNCWVQARYPIADFNRDFEASLREDGPADTLGGLVFGHLGRLPVSGETVIIADFEFLIVSLEGARIARMRVRRLKSSPPA